MQCILRRFPPTRGDGGRVHVLTTLLVYTTSLIDHYVSVSVSPPPTPTLGPQAVLRAIFRASGSSDSCILRRFPPKRRDGRRVRVLTIPPVYTSSVIRGGDRYVSVSVSPLPTPMLGPQEVLRVIFRASGSSDMPCLFAVFAKLPYHYLQCIHMRKPKNKSVRTRLTPFSHSVRFFSSPSRMASK